MLLHPGISDPHLTVTPTQEPRPEKKATPKLAMVNRQYGGPGVFVPSEEPSGHFQQRSGSFQDRSRRDSVSSLLPSNSSMGLDLYKPDYEQTVRARASRGASMEQLVNDMGELVVSDPRRRDTFPVSFHSLVSVLLSMAHLLHASRCNRASQRDQCRPRGTLWHHPPLPRSFRFRKATPPIPQLLITPTES